MPNSRNLGDAIHDWRVRRGWPDVADLANGLINNGFATEFGAHKLDKPDATTLTNALRDLEVHNVLPWLSPPYDQWNDLWEAFARHSARCLGLSADEAKEMRILIGRSFADTIRPE